MAEGDEDFEGSEDEEPKAKKSKKKLIIMIAVFGLITYQALTMTVLKPPPPTPEEARAAWEKKEQHYRTVCALANEMDPPAPAGGEGGAAEAPVPTSTTFLIPEPVIGPVIEIDAKTLNLAGGHFLKIGIALQLEPGTDPEEVEELENFKAIAAQHVLNEFSGASMDDILPKKKREKIRHQIGYDVCMESETEVSTVYFTEFVAQ